MSDDFFMDLGETLSKTAKDITTKADGFFENQKIRTKILSEQRMIDKCMTDIGNILYKKYVDGEAIDEDAMALCEEITKRKVTIANYREDVAKRKGQKVCAACGATVPSEAAFCMQCGAPCEKEEPQDQPPQEPEDAVMEEPEVQPVENSQNQEEEPKEQE